MPLSTEEQQGILNRVVSGGCPIGDGDRMAYYTFGIKATVQAMAPAVTLDAVPENVEQLKKENDDAGTEDSG